MKIVYLCADLGVPVLGWKGASLHLRALASALRRGAHEPAVVAPTLVRSPWEPPASFEVPVTHIPPTQTVDAAARGIKTFKETVGADTAIGGELRRILYNEELRLSLKRLLERTPPDAILERASLFGTAGSLVAAELGVPHLVELNAPLAEEQRSYRAGTLQELAAAAERWTLSRADAVLAVSGALAEHAVAAGAARRRVHVLPNGVDPARFRRGERDATFRRRLGLGQGPLIGFVGNLRPWHGVEALPELLRRLAERHPTVELVVAGDGELRATLEADLRRLGLGRRAALLGTLPHEDIPRLLRELDVALAPYPRPTHAFYFSPLKLFEYMACGVCVVASALGQIEEIVRDGENGLLVTAGDLESLTAACDRALADDELRTRLGETAADEVERRFTWDANAARIVELAGTVEKLRQVA